MKEVRIGVVGYGARIHGVIHHIIRGLDPDVRVCGIVDPDERGVRARLAQEDRDGVVFYPTLDALVRKGRPDALAIGTRCNLHTPYAIKAAKYDLPLYLEKPVATSMAQAVALEKAFRKTRCRVVVSFPLRVSPLCELARQHIAAGAVGRPIHIQAVNYVPYGNCYFEDAYRDYSITRGLFLQKATHDLDYMSYLVDSPIVRVSAVASLGQVYGGNQRAGLTCSKCKLTESCQESPRNRSRHGAGRRDHLCLFSRDIGTPQAGMNEDCSSALIEFANGAQGVYSQVFFARRDAAARGATVSGYDGTVSFDWYTNELKHVRHHAPFSATEKAGAGMSHFGGDAELARDFLDLIQGRIRRSRTPIETGLSSVYACLAAKDAVKRARWMPVRQLLQP